MKQQLLFFLLLIPSLLFSQNEEKAFDLKLKGLIFGDVYYVQKNHIPEANNSVGAVMRRAYLTFDAKYKKKWFSRIRIEANQSGEYQTYNFEAEIKDLFIGYKIANHKFIAGLSPSRTFDLIEDVWSMRYLLRTPMDLHGVSSRDLGLSAEGLLSSKLNLSYRAMVGFGTEFGAESGDGLKYMGAISWRPNKSLVIDFYADHEKLEGKANRTMFQFFIGCINEEKKLSWGIQYSNQDRQEEPRLELLSAFIIGRVYKKINAIVRFDRIMEPNSNGDNISYIPFDPNTKATMFIGGLEFPVGKYLTFTPNILTVFYDTNDDGYKPTTDMTYRLTIFFEI